MIHIAICDDEEIFRDKLQDILLHYMADRGILIKRVADLLLK